MARRWADAERVGDCYAAAALVTMVVLPRWGWRAVFFIGILPAFLTIWVRARVEEPRLWRETVRRRGSLSASFNRAAAFTIPLTIMNAFTLFGWWGFNLWLPGYLSLPESAGGRGFSATTMSAFVIAMQAGMWLGYVTFGFISDRVGRKRTYVTYTRTAAILILVYLDSQSADPAAPRPAGGILCTGNFSGFGAVTAEVYPTEIRASAQGFTYNMGRVTSALRPSSSVRWHRTTGSRQPCR